MKSFKGCEMWEVKVLHKLIASEEWREDQFVITGTPTDEFSSPPVADFLTHFYGNDPGTKLLGVRTLGTVWIECDTGKTEC